ncbi:hypothetical protein KI387_003890, partial [Taxus chinensis]
CSTRVESLPKPPPLSSYEAQIMLQKMCIQIGIPLKQPPMQQKSTSSLHSSVAMADGFISHVVNPAKSALTPKYGISSEAANYKGLNEVVVHCSSDFVTTSKKACMRIRRVRLLGLEGAGKTSLYCALLGRARETTNFKYEGILPDTDYQESVAGGISIIDSAGVNLQDLPGEVTRLKQELSFGAGQLNKRIDLIVLVHNLAHKIPFLHHTLNKTNPCPAATHSRPALLWLMDEVAAAGIPWVLAITNKYAVSADRRMSAANAVMEIYQVPSNISVVLNSRSYVVHGTGTESSAFSSSEINSKEHTGNNKIQGAAQWLISAPMNLVQMPFRKKEVILRVEGVNTLRKIIHQVLKSHEDHAFQ